MKIPREPMKTIYLLAPIFLLCFFGFGQLKNQKAINKTIDQIEHDKKLRVREYDRVDLLGNNYGEGVVKVWYSGQEIQKIEERVGLAFGISRELVYFQNGLPIKIIEIEENFKKTKKGFDESQLEEVFRMEIYVLGKAKSKIENYYITKKELGQRFFTRQNDFSEYLEPYQMAETFFEDN